MPAEKGGIEARSHIGYGNKIQGRVGVTEGNNFLWMKRSSKKPNIFSQQIRNLQAGRSYSVKMFTADYKDLIEATPKEQKREQTHTVRIEIEGTEVDSLFQHVFSRSGGVGLNYHWLLFRAKDKTARMIISDWASENKPAGPIGQELIYNFIEIQPYLED